MAGIRRGVTPLEISKSKAAMAQQKLGYRPRGKNYTMIDSATQRKAVLDNAYQNHMERLANAWKGDEEQRKQAEQPQGKRQEPASATGKEGDAYEKHMERLANAWKGDQ